MKLITLYFSLCVTRGVQEIALIMLWLRDFVDNNLSRREDEKLSRTDWQARATVVDLNVFHHYTLEYLEISLRTG